MPRCKNCDSDLTAAFCATCGQRADTHRINWAWLGHEAVTSVLVLDRGILFTLKELFTRPGHALREYLDGKRKPHFKPVAFVLVMAAIYSLLFRFMPPDYSSMNAEMQKTMEMMNRVMGQYYAFVELGLIPVIAFFTWLFMRNYGDNFVEHLVIQSFLSGQRIAFGIIVVPLNTLGFQVATAASGLLLLAYFAASLFAFVQLYSNRSAVQVIFRTIAAMVAFFLFLFACSIGIGLAYAYFKGRGIH